DWSSDVCSSDLSVPQLLDPRRLAGALSEVVQLRPSDVAPPHHLDLVDDRRVEREHALDSHSEADLAHGERGGGATTVAGDDHALENLDPLAPALDDAHVHLHVVTGAKAGDVVAQLGVLE